MSGPGGDDREPLGQLAHLLANERDVRLGLDPRADLARERDAVDRQRRARGNPVRVRGREHERARAAQLLVQEPDRVLGRVGAQAVRADELRQLGGLVRGRALHRAHLEQAHPDAAPRELPGRLAAREPAADHLQPVPSLGNIATSARPLAAQPPRRARARAARRPARAGRGPGCAPSASTSHGPSARSSSTARAAGEASGISARWTGRTASGPSTAARRSSASRIGVAPSRSSRFVPRHCSVSIGPGTTSTSRPCSSAWRAVQSEPLFSRASTTSTAPASPLISRLRSGKWYGCASASGGRSESQAPPAARMRSASPRCPLGVTWSRPEASTATVGPPPVERALVRRRVDPVREPRDDRRARARELGGERARGRGAARRRPARADDRERRAAGSAPRTQTQERRVRDLAQRGRELGVARGERADPGGARRREAALAGARAPGHPARHSLAGDQDCLRGHARRRAPRARGAPAVATGPAPRSSAARATTSSSIATPRDRLGVEAAG